MDGLAGKRLGRVPANESNRCRSPWWPWASGEDASSATDPTSTSSMSSPRPTTPRRASVSPASLPECWAGTPPDGVAYEVDAGLRPEGKQGSLARSMEAFTILLRDPGRALGVAGPDQSEAGRRRPGGP